MLLRDWIGLDSVDGLTFDVALHVGTLAAVLAYFERDLRSLFAGWKESFALPRSRWELRHRLSWYILIATLPAMGVGALLEGALLEVLRSPSVAVVTLVIGGMLFLVFEKYSEKSRTMEQLTLSGCLLIGFAQAVALIPGVSRSGIAILAGLALKLTRAEAARFAFLLGAPILVVAGAKDAIDAWGQHFSLQQFGVFGVGVLTAAVFGWFTIKYLLRFLNKHGLGVFAYYRFVLAGIVVLTMML
ncbi:MAG: Undecaprenyl-diphosphatase [Candidatus Krumholzibacteriota bacterium]|nr:Undecaprenyl-diphosphatase [Candidatus Krumholzibacteriota bacterium]